MHKNFSANTNEGAIEEEENKESKKTIVINPAAPKIPITYC